MRKKPIHIIEHEGKTYGLFQDKRLCYACNKCSFVEICKKVTIDELRVFAEKTKCAYLNDIPPVVNNTYYKELK